jgi:hypothetical protein
MGMPNGARVGLLSAAVLMAVTFATGGHPPVQGDRAAGGRDGYCVPTSGIPVGHICVLVG